MIFFVHVRICTKGKSSLILYVYCEANGGDWVPYSMVMPNITGCVCMKFHLRYASYITYIYYDYKIFIITVLNDLFQLKVIL
jgi:hypothetical protein